MNRPHRPRVTLLMAGVLATLTLLAACGSATIPKTGHLAGHVYTQGGKDATTQPAEAKLTATPVDASADVHTVDTASDGSFSLDLPPGNYTLTGTLTTRIPGGRTSPQEVKISAGATTEVNLYAIYP